MCVRSLFLPKHCLSCVIVEALLIFLQAPYATTIHCVRAVKALAVAQEKLDRMSEAQQSLVEGLDMLDQLGTRELPADSLEANLDANEG